MQAIIFKVVLLVKFNLSVKFGGQVKAEWLVEDRGLLEAEWIVQVWEGFKNKTANYPHFVDKGGGGLECG